jgi:hypothetical protein
MGDLNYCGSRLFPFLVAHNVKLSHFPQAGSDSIAPAVLWVD